MFRLFLRTLVFLPGFALAALSADAALAERRVALILGNAKYEHAGTLTNTINDANAIAAVLKRAGFDSVDLRVDLGVVALKRAVRDFAAAASDADVAVIYYSGHGIEAAGVNYLVPTDAKLANINDVEDEAVTLDRLLLATASVKTLSLVILDACRENPFVLSGDKATITRAVGGHLLGVEMTTPNTLIAYAAKAGSLSYDGTGPNSPFTTALVKYIAQPGLDIRIALGMVRDDVLATTGNRQEPFVYGSLGGKTVALSSAPIVAPTSDPLAATAADYGLAERVGTAPAWRAFIQAHREGGFYVELARAQLGRSSPSTPEPSPEPSRQQQAALPAPVEPIAKPVAPLSEAEICLGESAQLTKLRNDPSSDAVLAFAQSSKCVALRPQVNRLLESAGLKPPPEAVEPTHLASRSAYPGGCDGEARELERLRAEPDVDSVKAFYEKLTCGPLRPQVQRMMESLGDAPPPAKAGVQRGIEPPARTSEIAANPCPTEATELARLRTQLDRNATLAFAGRLRCKALGPQVGRLLESLKD